MKEVLLDAADDIAAMDDTLGMYADFLALEAQAQHITHFSNSIMPEPFQNWVVAKTVLGARYSEMPDEQLEYMVDMRAERGKYYAAGHVNATFFVTEAVLDTAPIDKKSWKIQLDHLINMARMPSVAVHVIPGEYFTSGEDAMTLLDLPGGNRRIYLESDALGDCLSKFTPAIERIGSAFKSIGSLALDEAASMELIRQRL